MEEVFIYLHCRLASRRISNYPPKIHAFKSHLPITASYIPLTIFLHTTENHRINNYVTEQSLSPPSSNAKYYEGAKISELLLQCEGVRWTFQGQVIQPLCQKI